MTSHLGMMFVFAACVSIVFGTLTRDEPRQQVRMGWRIFAGLTIGAVVVGWAMFLAFA